MSATLPRQAELLAHTRYWQWQEAIADHGHTSPAALRTHAAYLNARRNLRGQASLNTGSDRRRSPGLLGRSASRTTRRRGQR
jgi:hypothetical protein